MFADFSCNCIFIYAQKILWGRLSLLCNYLAFCSFDRIICVCRKREKQKNPQGVFQIYSQQDKRKSQDKLLFFLQRHAREEVFFPVLCPEHPQLGRAYHRGLFCRAFPWDKSSFFLFSCNTSDNNFNRTPSNYYQRAWNKRGRDDCFVWTVEY